MSDLKDTPLHSITPETIILSWNFHDFIMQNSKIKPQNWSGKSTNWGKKMTIYEMKITFWREHSHQLWKSKLKNFAFQKAIENFKNVQFCTFLSKSLHFIHFLHFRNFEILHKIFWTIFTFECLFLNVNGLTLIHLHSKLPYFEFKLYIFFQIVQRSFYF